MSLKRHLPLILATFMATQDLLSKRTSTTL